MEDGKSVEEWEYLLNNVYTDNKGCTITELDNGMVEFKSDGFYLLMSKKAAEKFDESFKEHILKLIK